jgi:hypothetical protein
MARKQQNNSINVYATQLSKYIKPDAKEYKNREWVEYGDNNDFFDYLIDRYTNSATNNAIINGIVKMIYGKGLGATNGRLKPEAYAQALSLFKKNDLRRFINDRKLLGMAAFQVTYEKGKVKSATHFPMNTLRPEKMNEDGEIEAWYYHPNWKEKTYGEEPERIKSFGFGNQKENEMFVLAPYVAGYYYFSPVDYFGALPYAQLEEDIADYLINDCKNGFSPTTIINFNNGVPEEEKQRKIVRNVEQKTTGSTGKKTIVAFNNNKESETTVESIPLNDAPQHYQYLADECRNKLIVAHRVTSPMLIGVRESGGGLGNNADEIKTANLLFDNVVIKSYQEEIIDVIDEILAINDISLNLYFKTIEPLEFIDVDGLDKETSEEETGIEMSSHENDFDDDFGNEMLENLEGETFNDEEWELVDEREVNDENESIEDWANKLIKEKKSTLAKLAGIIKHNSNAKSSLDKDLYKVRYQYSEKYKSENSRDFCKQMMARTRNGVMYRKEDIDQASFRGVNKEHGHKNRGYSLFRFKGGVNCGHYWSEQLYRLKTKTDGTPYKDKALSSSEEVDKISGYKPNPSGWKDAQKAPKDMKDNGHHPNYRK